MTQIELRWYETTMQAQKDMAKSMERIATIFEAILEAVKDETEN